MAVLGANVRGITEEKKQIAVKKRVPVHIKEKTFS